ncbi:MAG: hypothetical protein Q9222_005585 [Ikaeria aurantiellina]
MTNTTVRQAAYTPQRSVPDSNLGQQLPWTEKVARSRAKAPVRRLSAGEETRSSPHTVRSYDTGPFVATWTRTQKATNSTTAPLFGLPSTPADHQASAYSKRQNRTVHFTDGAVETTSSQDSEESILTTQERLEKAFTLHAIHQAGGSVLRNEFAVPGPGKDKAPPERFSRLRLNLKNRTRILGHKAGFFLYDTSFKSFCDLADALVLHQYHQSGGFKIDDRYANKFIVDIEFDDGLRSICISERTTKDEETYKKGILPVLEREDPKPRIRVRPAEVRDEICDIDCACDDPNELEFEAPDIGSLRVLAGWDGWGDPSRLVENSQIFVSAIINLLFPFHEAPNAKMFNLVLPHGRTFSIHRDAGLVLNKEVQEAFRDIVTQAAEKGTMPKTIKLWCRRSSLQSALGDAVLSPGPKSPGLARNEGVIFVHRPARFTHFQYDAPHTLERFFDLVRTQLYPDASEKLRIRISPSEAFRKQGKLMTPMKEQSPGDYAKDAGNGSTFEQYWKEDVVGKWLKAEEDVWVVRVFDFIRVFDGRDEATKPIKWDMTTFKQRRARNERYKEWNVPPETLMESLAEISIQLLDVDPRQSAAGIVIHVIRDLPPGAEKEWLRWIPGQSFVDFMLEVLYKIDGDRIAIYPGDHEESDPSTTAMIQEVVQDMRAHKRRKILENSAVEGH